VVVLAAGNHYHRHPKQKIGNPLIASSNRLLYVAAVCRAGPPKCNVSKVPASTLYLCLNRPNKKKVYFQK
jgi:hypothetical protein